MKPGKGKISSFQKWLTRYSTLSYHCKQFKLLNNIYDFVE